MRQRVGKTWRECDSQFRKKNSTSHLFWQDPLSAGIKTWSKLFTPVSTCSNLFTPVHICSQLFTPVHTCSRLFTPHWLATLFAQWQLLIEFSPGESCFFSILRAIFLKLHIFTHLIESYPTVHGLSSCVRKKYIDPSGSRYYRDDVHLSHNAIFPLSNALIL